LISCEISSFLIAGLCCCYVDLPGSHGAADAAGHQAR